MRRGAEVGCGGGMGLGCGVVVEGVRVESGRVVPWLARGPPKVGLAASEL